jgi:anti-sigma regulatory factor (Ser/Thr protein kinase)
MPNHTHERHQAVVLAAGPSAPRAARDAIESCAGLESLEDIEFTVLLLAAELASNVVRHADLAGEESFELLIDRRDHSIRIETVDSGPGFDPLAVLARNRDPSSTPCPQGIVLLDRLADRWGFRRGRRFRIWFEIDLNPGRRPWQGRQRV